MAVSNSKTVYLTLAILLLTNNYVTSLIVPEELPTILSLIYSNIPPIKKGTDSRIGVGFRLGEHADFQVLMELGPQKETDPIGNTSETKRKRAAIMSAALKGNMGPWAQAVAAYQLEQQLKKIVDKYKIKLPQQTSKLNSDFENTTKPQTEASGWLSKWSEGLATNPLEIETKPRKVTSNTNRLKVVSSQSSNDSQKSESAKNDLIILKKLFGSPNNETANVE